MRAVAATAAAMCEQAVRASAAPPVDVGSGGHDVRDTTMLRQTTGRAVMLVMAACDIVATGVFGGNERLVALARSLAFPGIGFAEWQPLLASATIAVAVGAVVAWLRWGVDWFLAALWLGAATVTWFVVPPHEDLAAPAVDVFVVQYASHEFAVVLALMAVVARVRLACSSWDGSASRTGRRTRARLAPNAGDSIRATAISLIAGGDCQTASDELRSPAVVRRARRIAQVARWRFRGDPLRSDQAATRAGLVLAGLSTPSELERFRDECRRSLTGVPASEPTWVRLLDGTLAALALERVDEQECVQRWRRTFDNQLALRHGRRRSAVHAPSMLTVGTASEWEHATASVLARRAGWIGDDDWVHLRRSCLGAAARGASTPADARLVAAGRVWASLVEDTAAARILHRPTLAADDLAGAIASLADAVAAG